MTDQSERAIGRVADMRRYLETIIFVLEERIMIRTDDFHYEMWKEAHRDLEEPEPSQKSFEWKMTAFEADHFAYLTATKGYSGYVEHCRVSGYEQLTKDAFPHFVSEAMSRIKDDWFVAILRKYTQ